MSQANSSNTTPEVKSRLAYFPINLFGAIMGFSGLTLGALKLVQLNYLPPVFFSALAGFTFLLFTVITATYLLKTIKHPHEVKHDFDHPIAINFFPAFSISLILISLFIKEFHWEVASLLWHLGMMLHFILTIVILNSWLHHEKWQITHMNPAWFIPVVGNIIVPLGAVHFSHPEIGWFFFSIGLVFWILLFSLVVYRLFFHPPLMKILEPTLFILIAPPAVGFTSYLALNGHNVDNFAKILFYIALFLTILLLSRVAQFIRVPFALSWWAYTFPIAAMILAGLEMYQQMPFSAYLWISIGLYIGLAILILHLLVKTLIAIKNKQLCKPHPTPPKP